MLIHLNKISADSDCNHEIKKMLAPWKKSYDKPPSILKRRDITLPRKVCIVKAKVFLFFFPLQKSFFFICSEFCHTLEWNSHGFTCVPHPDPPSHLSLHPLPLGFPSAPGPSTCLMHPTWAGDLFHPRHYTCFDAVLLKHPTLAFSHRV